jgi:release factor glutamine methyltransferase
VNLSFQEAINITIHALKKGGFEKKAAFDVTSFLMHVSRILIGHVVRKTVFPWDFDLVLTTEQTLHLNTLLLSIQKGIPLEYVTGKTIFLDQTFSIRPGVLIPRVQTELLVLSAVQKLQNPKIGLEIGLGSGVISFSLLRQFDMLQMIGSEVSQSAWECVMQNQRELGLYAQRLHVIKHDNQASVMEPFLNMGLQGSVDFIISNPPYLRNQSECDEDVFLHEPHEALFVENPCFFYEQIATQSASLLKKHGWVFLEVPFIRAAIVTALFNQLFLLESVPTFDSGTVVFIARRI